MVDRRPIKKDSFFFKDWEVIQVTINMLPIDVVSRSPEDGQVDCVDVVVLGEGFRVDHDHHLVDPF